MIPTPGVVTPSFATLAAYHPQFALAIACGVKPRPNNRTITFRFSSTAVPQSPQPGSFDQFVSSYSVFTGFDYTIDPTNAFVGNVLKTTSDKNQKEVTGLSLQLVIRTDDGDFSPIPNDTMLQLVPAVLNPTAGMWHFSNPDDMKAQLTVQTSPPAAPFTVQLVFGVIQLGDGKERYMCLEPAVARAKLQEMGLLGACCP
jgi:hypothetical protein